MNSARRYLTLLSKVPVENYTGNMSNGNAIADDRFRNKNWCKIRNNLSDASKISKTTSAIITDTAISCLQAF